MSASRRVKAVLIVCAGLIPASAAAQSAFVQGGLSREVRRFSHEGARSAFDGTASGIWVGGAGFITTNWSVGIELDRGGDVEFVDTVSVTVTGRPTQIATRYMSRRGSLNALAGYHTSAAGRVRLGCYAGLSFTAFRREISSDAPAIVLQQPAEPSVFNERVTGALVGLDLAIRVAPHFAVVPALRAQGLSLSGDLSGFSIRPSLGVRVWF